MDLPALMTVTQYAKHRGVDIKAVTKAIDAGRITCVETPGGRRMIDPDAADADWAANTDASAKIGGDAQRAARGIAPTETPEATDDEDGEPATYAASRAKREAYQAKLAKVTYEERIGKLVLAEEVHKQAFKTARTVRENILNIPDRIASQLASEPDPHKVHLLLSDELRRALESLAVEEPT
jgi:hypothetical protein